MTLATTRATSVGLRDVGPAPRRPKPSGHFARLPHARYDPPVSRIPRPLRLLILPALALVVYLTLRPTYAIEYTDVQLEMLTDVDPAATQAPRFVRVTGTIEQRKLGGDPPLMMQGERHVRWPDKRPLLLIPPRDAPAPTVPAYQTVQGVLHARPADTDNASLSHFVLVADRVQPPDAELSRIGSIAGPVLWALVVGFTALYVRRELASRRRAALDPHTCPACGYDCRATPDHCPECGAVQGNARAA
jgi:hypothetical protein